MNLSVRDEEDIIAGNFVFHLSGAVDHGRETTLSGTYGDAWRNGSPEMTILPEGAAETWLRLHVVRTRGGLLATYDDQASSKAEISEGKARERLVRDER